MCRPQKTLAAFVALFALAVVAPPSRADDCVEPTVDDLQREANSPQARFPQLSSTQLQLADQLRNHSGFPTALNISLLLGEEEIVYLRSLTPQEATQYEADLIALKQTLQSTGQVPSYAYQLLRLTGDELSALQNAAQFYSNNFPQLQQMPPEEAAAVYFRASHTLPSVKAWTEALVPAPLSEEDCLELCAQAQATAVNAAVDEFQEDLDGCGANVWCFINATVDYGQALIKAERERKACDEECGYVQCRSDLDCDADEYCYKGVLGVGRNECRTKKNEGQMCSRSGQCDSGCCKYKFFVNPLSATCRDASECN